MLSSAKRSSRVARYALLGLATVSVALALSVDSADARRHRRHHRSEARQSYNPAFASIIVDANSGAVLYSNNPDAPRHPASLTKIMTLYLLFERLESGKLTLDSEMEVSEHASQQSPTKLGLRPGQKLRVEDAIKGLVTRSANDASVVIAEAISGDEDDFAKLMTRKARALGMTRTVYRNASGLPDSEQITSARDQSVLGRAIQDRFPRYYRYFSTTAFNWRGRPIRNHNRLLGSVEGVDGIKTGYTRASGFNLVSSIRRGNRHLVGVVLGGRSGGSRDATMRSLLAEHLEKGSPRRTVAAITERSPAEANAEVAEDRAQSRSSRMVQVDGAVQVASAASESLPQAQEEPVQRQSATSTPRVRVEPSPLTSGVISTQAMAAIPGSSEPMKPHRVKTVQVKSGPVRVASAGPGGFPSSAAAAPSRSETQDTTYAVASRTDLPPQPAAHGTGKGILGVLPASSVSGQASATVPPVREAAVQQNGAIKPASAAHTGWMVQVGALESESEARARLEAARNQAKSILGKADPFTETITKGDKKLYRARFAGLDRDQAEAACRTLKRTISCIAVRN
jgi:D-alanyl-D-alanine carboxypeptidase